MEKTHTISRDQLKSWLDGKREFTLIDVLPEEYWEKSHLPAAKNACVFKVDFLDQIARIAPERGGSLVVYCSSARSRAARTAAEKLVAAGYTNVLEYHGGTENWCAGGFPFEGKEPAQSASPVVEDRTYKIDTGTSVVEWIGRNITGAHKGTLRLRDGSLVVKNGRCAGGEFTIEMNSMRNSDLEDSTLRRMLIRHLASDDFFDVEKYPTARFEITEVSPISGAAPGAPNFTVRGRLTIKDVAREISFPAVIARKDDGSLAAEAHFDIDRTKWNIIYGSGKFYESLGMHLVYDDVSIGLNLVAK